MISAIVVAAGSSRRMGFDKLTADLAGRPVFVRALERFLACSAIDDIMLVVQPERLDEFRAALELAGLQDCCRFVPGGVHRHLSVWAGICALRPATELVAVHDAARPLIDPPMIDRALADAARWGAVAVAAPMVETLKRASEQQLVVDSVDRASLWTMQTPQVFRREWLCTAYEKVLQSGETVTDEVSALQLAGYPVRLVANPGWNLKITYPRDLELAQVLFNLEAVS